MGEVVNFRVQATKNIGFCKKYSGNLVLGPGGWGFD